MIDLVYILKEGASNWEDNEIRYSLRSAEKYLKIRKVFIVGYKPEFLNNIIHIPCRDDYREKHKNATQKIIMAALDKRVGDKFALMNDDFFITKQLDNIPYYYDGKIINYLDNNQQNETAVYWKTMKRTMEALNKEALNYELHCPIVFEKAKIKELIDRFDLWRVLKFQSSGGYLIRSLYGNYFKVGGKEIKDNKFYWGKMRERGDFNKNNIFFSVENKIIKTEIIQFMLNVLYPNKSKYENN